MQETAMTDILLSIRDVSNYYTSRRLGLFGKQEKRQVLNHISLELRKGEILLCGQKPGRAQIQMVFQEPGASLNPAKKIGWLVEEPLVIHKIGAPEERVQKIDEMLVCVGLDPSYKTRRVHELSGGQKQRVCIARALILQPRLLIADEAISSLDVSAGAQILNLFRELHENHGLDILFISHNGDAVEYLCDRVAVIRAGKI
jgi:ABC-type dipeptide/oligopeptide/nickel transport system ATPase subunit